MRKFITWTLVLAALVIAGHALAPEAPQTAKRAAGPVQFEKAAHGPLERPEAAKQARQLAKVFATAELVVDESRWPLIADHIEDAQAAGESVYCTLDRAGSETRRDTALSGIPTRDGFDRDEYPFAVCAEGGLGADVRHVPSSENRSHGGWLGNALEAWPDGTVLIVIVEDVP